MYIIKEDIGAKINFYWSFVYNYKILHA